MLDRLFLTISTRLPLLDGAEGTTVEGGSLSGLGSNILKTVAGVGGVLIAIILIISIVKAVLNYAKGNGSVSIFSIVGRVIFLGVCIGLIALALNWDSTFGDVGKKIADKGTNLVSTVANDLEVSAKS